MIRGLLVLFFSFLVGELIIFKTNEKFAAHRFPAAIRQSYDFTHLSGSALDYALRQRIVNDLEIVKADDSLTFTLGQFAFSSSDGQKFFGCDYYQNIIIVLEAEGAAVSGDKPTIELSTPCLSSDDINKLKPIKFPYKQIKSERPQDGEMSLVTSAKINLRFNHLPDSWPEQWAIISIRFESPQYNLTVDRNDIVRLIGKPLVLGF